MTESGISVWCSKTATCCLTPLSYISNSSLPSVPTIWPVCVLTVATTRTRLTLVRKTVGCWARSAPARRAAANQRLACRNLARWNLPRRKDIVIPLSFHPDLAVHEVFLLPDRSEERRVGKE